MLYLTTVMSSRACHCRNASWFILTITSERFLRVRNAVSVGPSPGGGVLRGFRRDLLLPLLLLGFNLLSADSVELKIRVVRLRLDLGLWGGVVVFIDCLPLLGRIEEILF